MDAPPADSRLPVSLRELRRLLDRALRPGETGPLASAAAACIDRLDRDLLPRTAGGSTHLVVGIVGPNNAGKSALFNALVGERLSPSRPTGGATRRLIGAAHPELLERLEGEPTLARFPVARVSAGSEGVALATEPGSEAAHLLLVATEALADGVLLVDTPDFDSIRTTNRHAAEALLRVADLALVVVTRHTYQNREVVEFLQGWLAHGRPWLLVYNESLAPDVTAAHAAKLGSDVGMAPLATFAAPFDLAVAEERNPLVPRALAGAVGEAAPRAGAALTEWLLDLPRAGELKGRALAASLGQLRDELEVLSRGAEEERALAADILERGRDHARRLGEEVASAAMPMGPFLQAFRAVLDRRPTLIQRGLRGALRRARSVLERGVARIRGAPPEPVRGKDSKLVELEREALESAWPVFFEALARELPSPALEEVDPESAARLAADLAPDCLVSAGRTLRATLADDPEALRAFQATCEELIEAQLVERGNEWFFQLAVDALHLVPAVAAGVVIVKTGGLGVDVAVGGAGALSTLLAERLSKLLGSGVAWRARERWTRMRGLRLAEAALAAALETAAPRLERRARELGEIAPELSRCIEEVPWKGM